MEDPIEYHRRNRGKIRVEGKVKVETEEDMSLAYTPGVAEPSREIADDRSKSYEYTTKGEMAAVVSDGSAVLGLGDVGPEAAVPVMEGKALLIRELAGVSAFPVVLDEDDTGDLIDAAESLHPVFGFMMLEDIASPECFRVEEELRESLDIPVFHDDQHGAAVSVLAGIKNALQVVGKDLEEVSATVVGAGAAGIATTDLLLEAGVGEVKVVDRPGIIHGGMEELNEYQREIGRRTNPEGEEGGLQEALRGSDVLVGLSAPGIVSKEMVKSMKDDAVVFALANPDPEITYSDAREAGAAVVGTGRSDEPNQVNNSLAFPGIVKGALDCRASGINDDMKMAAAEAIASLVEPGPENILPSALNRDLPGKVAEAMVEAAGETGVCRV
ncbi:MAG: NADP-dependent malic enzyme [Candidatus Nanohaloarchaea archaeon]|nr:NADP-dependent malic enzyme [Candidatus Nanohaloarchaea archaeon]